MKLSLLFSAVLASCTAAYTSPPVSVRVDASWPAPDLVTQYLETLALEAPREFFPFLAYLTSHHSLYRILPAPLQPASAAVAAHYEKAGLSPIFAPPGLLQPNETYALLETAATRSLLLRSRGLRESLHVSLANREASVTIEGMRGVWAERERNVVEWEKARVVVENGVEAHERDRLLRGDVKAKWTTSATDRACASWIDVGGKKACTVQEFWMVVGNEQQEEKGPIALPSNLPSPERPDIFPFDHVSPPGANPHLPRFVLYGSPTSPSFQLLFDFLYSLSEPRAIPVETLASPAGTAASLTTAANFAAPHGPRLQFVLRWKPASKDEPNLVLTGYGAALDIKKSDYLVIDDRLATTESPPAASPERDEPLLGIEGDLAPKMETVKKSDVPELSLRTAQFILNSAEPFRALTTLTSAFPRLASHLPALVPSPDAHLLSEVSMNQMSFPRLTMRPGFYLNGVELAENEVDPFALIRLMRKERKYLADLVGLNKHMLGADARRILIDGSPKTKSGARGGMITAEVLGELYDATDRQEGGQVILWWNDLEKDTRYKSWSKSVRDLLRPTYPGSMNLIARNLNNVVLVLDLTQPNALALVIENIKTFVSRGIPVRFGVVPLVSEQGDETAVQRQVAQALWYLTDTLGRSAAMAFLNDLYLASPEAAISEEVLRQVYDRTVAAVSAADADTQLASFEAVQQGIGKKATAIHSRLSKTRDYLKRLGVPLAGMEPNGKATLGSFFMNGAFFPIDEDFSQNLQRTLGLHIQFLSQEAYLNSLTNDVDAKFYFADLPTTHRRRNQWIFPSETSPLKFVNLMDAFDGINKPFVQNFYIEGTTGETNETTGLDIEAPPASSTLYVIADLNDLSGIELAKVALQLADKTTQVRVSFVHNPLESDEAHPWALSNLLYLLHRNKLCDDVLPIEIRGWIGLELGDKGPKQRDGRDWSDENPLKKLLPEGAASNRAFEAQLFWDELQWFRHKLGFQAGENGLVINGRVIGPFADGAFELGDLRSLLDYELEKRIDSVVTAVNSTSLDLDLLTRSARSHMVNIASSIVGVASLPDPAAGAFGPGAAERRRDYLGMAGNNSAVFGHNERNALFEVAVIVDPATELAQRWAPIIKTLSDLAFVHVRLYLNPAFHLDEIPIKRFYEYSFRPELEFDSVTGKEVAPSIRFDNVPEDVLFTFSADTQQSWLAFPKTSVHDLDNIRLADLPAARKAEGVEAVLELEALVIEGHARDMPTGKPPRGLQLELRSGATESEDEQQVDTIVMANLGYFQFKANPGLWRLAIRPGRSSEVFELESAGADGWKSPDVAKAGNSLVVSTLEGLTLYPRFRRKAGHELTELLDESAAASALAKRGPSVVDRIKNMIPFFAPSPNSLVSTGKKADINVFTVASGLLYERMAFLMMVSVMRHTKSTVKFWLIQNFLSPSFKAFIPHMAREYGFDYELVTYKWPHWLRTQKEKQRTIWGYKILFLDVLFPLDLDRVVFVDSDQIVRTDLKELVDMDIGGAPYAFAPMGDDRAEMEGFRFWKTGYWKNHLQGRPYHISALYLVDLDRFRQIATGDRLRQQYQALSADPNSLANLDQDLPNNSQNIIPIFTLDKSWLWCETWCSDESLAEAKTIDLCNNPLTKEEKLKRAKRLIPEWTVYDDEVAALAKRVATETSASDASAFVVKADELEQAVQQKKERAKHVEEEEKKAAGSAEHVKDEL
ncbi:hypothetical protein JCM10207_008942 [Rhodosporidiobolus poonsookiae]